MSQVVHTLLLIMSLTSSGFREPICVHLDISREPHAASNVGKRKGVYVIMINNILMYGFIDNYVSEN